MSLNTVGGIPAILGVLGRAGLLDEAACTCHGCMKDWIAQCPPAGRRDRSRDRGRLQPHRRPQGHARQPCTGLRRGEAFRLLARNVPAFWPCARVQQRGRSLQGDLRRDDQPGRRGGHSRRTPATPACARCSRPRALSAAWGSISPWRSSPTRFSGASNSPAHRPCLA